MATSTRSLMLNLMSRGLIQSPITKLRLPKVPSPILPNVNQPGPSTRDYALYSYLNSKSGSPKSANLQAASMSRQGAQSEEPGLLSKIFDWLSQGQYASANIGKEIIDVVQGEEDIAGALEDSAKAIGGMALNLAKPNLQLTLGNLPGVGDIVDQAYEETEDWNPYRRWAQNIKEVTPNMPAWQRETLGLGFDIFLDPSTYVGVGGAGKLLKRANSVDDLADLAGKTVTSNRKNIAGIQPFLKGSEVVRSKKTFRDPTDLIIPKINKQAVGDVPVPSLKVAGNLEVVPKATRQAPKALADDLAIGASRIDPYDISRVDVSEGRFGIPKPSQSTIRGSDTAALNKLIRENPRGFRNEYYGEWKPNPPLKRLIAKIKHKEKGKPLTWDRIKGHPEYTTGAKLVPINNSSGSLTWKLLKGFSPAGKTPRTFEQFMKQTGQVLTPKGRLSVASAMEAVDDVIKHGAAAKYIPPTIAPATGKAFDIAESIADDTIDAVMKSAGRSTMRVKNVAGKTVLKDLAPEIEGAQQVAMFTKIVGTTKSSKQALAMLKSAEDHLIRLGVNPVSGGIRARLSDVLAETYKINPRVSTQDILTAFSKGDSHILKMAPEIRTAIQRVRGHSTAMYAERMEQIVENAKTAIDDIPLQYAGKASKIAERELIEKSTYRAIELSMSQADARGIKRLIENYIDVNKLPAENWLDSAEKQLYDMLTKGEGVRPSLIDDFHKAIERTVGSTYKSLGVAVDANKAIETFMTAFSTHWGRGELRRLSQDLFEYGEKNADDFALALRRLYRHATADEAFDAWRVVQGTLPSPGGRVQEMADSFTNYLATVFKLDVDSIMRTNAKMDDLDLSVLERSWTYMDDINSELRKIQGKGAFQFQNGKIKSPFTNEVFDFSKGTDWLASYKIARPPKDPIGFIYDLQLAAERVTRRNVFLDEIGARFGTLTKDASHTFELPYSRVKGFYLPDEIGKQVVKVMKDIDSGPWTPKSPIVRFYGKILHAWKAGVTIYLPSHHIRNFIGDSYLFWLAGYNNPKYFIQSRRILASQRTRYLQAIKAGDVGPTGYLSHLAGYRGGGDDLFRNIVSDESVVKRLTSQTEVVDKQVAKWLATQGDDVISNVRGTAISANDYYTAAHQHGILLNATKSEDIFGETLFGKVRYQGQGLQSRLAQPLGGRGHNTATRIAEYREHSVRMAHFVAATEKNLKEGKNLRIAFERAAHEVRKWHPDGRDLTQFEQRMRYLIPFYSWTRKSIPLLIQGMVQHPAKVVFPSRFNIALQESLGISQTDGGELTTLDPFPNNQLFPDWIRSYGLGPIGDAESDNWAARVFGLMSKNYLTPLGPGGYTVINPGNPFMDTVQQFGGMGKPTDFGRGLQSQVSPFLKTPFELASDRKWPGAPISKDEGGAGVLPYLAESAPFVGPVARITDYGKRDPRQGLEQGFDKDALINLFTAIGFRSTAPYIKQAEFESKERLRRRYKKNG